jgi:anaerobic dimethyl sulfoxide reductase subunit B (iron-sulfur subunit)
MSTEYAFSFDADKCIQCYGCQAACRIWRETEPGIHWRRVETRWSGIYPDVSLTSLSLACQHCVDPQCVAACPEGAITKRGEDGLVVVDKDLCTGCQMCQAACPFDIPCFAADGTMQKCDLCRPDLGQEHWPAPCVATCPTGALQCGRQDVAAKKAQESALEQKMRPQAAPIAS